MNKQQLNEAFPRLTKFLGIAFYDGWDETGAVDPAEAIAGAWRNVRFGESEALLAEYGEFRRTIDIADVDHAVWELSTARLPHVTGTSRLAWLAYTDHLIRQPPAAAAATPSPSPLAPPWTSQFDGVELQESAVAMVLRQHAEIVGGLTANSIGMSRLNLYAQLDRELGTISHNGETYPATAAVVVMSWHFQRLVPFVWVSYPEVDLPAEPRERWPELTHLLGGYFSQRFRDMDQSAWSAEANWQMETAPEVKALVGRQLDEVLSIADDDGLRETIVALGCYVLPTALRAWLGRIRERIARTELWTA